MRAFFICLALCTVFLSVAGSAAETDPRYRDQTVPKQAGVATKQPETGMGQWLGKIVRGHLPGEHERGHVAVTGAFRDVAAAASSSTVRVLSDGLQTALGVVVRSDGLILTKASELNGKLECILADNSRLPAVKVAEHDDCDLALLQVSRQQLPVARWSQVTELPVGSWLVSSNLESQPIAIGVVSALPRSSPVPKAVLGVRMQPVDNGVRINAVVPGTGAARAGIRSGDIISAINGRQAVSPDTITEVISRLRPGDSVTLSVFREESPLSMKATLGDLARMGGLEQAELMESLGGPLSRRREGFPSIIQHDSVIRPRECGGPVVDLDGRVVGVNIARASRVATYALPAQVAREAVQTMVGQMGTTLAGTTTVATAAPPPAPAAGQ